MNRLKKNCSFSLSFEVPKLCISRQEATVPVISKENELQVPTETRARSSSFDSCSLHNKESQEFLEVPSASGRRSNSFDVTANLSASSDEGVSDQETNSTRKLLKWRRASYEIPKLCIHCVHLETLANQELDNTLSEKKSQQLDLLSSNYQVFTSSSESLYSSSSDLPPDSDYDYSEKDENESDYSPNVLSPVRGRSPDLPGQISPRSTSPLLLQSPVNIDSPTEENDDETSYTNVLTLEVPVMKSHRSSSVDAGYLQVSPSDSWKSLSGNDYLEVPPVQSRSSSIDVRLPTDENGHYIAINANR